MIGYYELISKLKEIKNLGFVKTHRTGNTGIGKTLEDLLGIVENNIPGPNGRMIELKSARKNAKSMLTLKACLLYLQNHLCLKKLILFYLKTSAIDLKKVIIKKNYILQ